jgi:DNA polymerase III delta prime subunit
MGAYGRYLIGIIDDADSLSETVQNKLLKTLEEPRPDVILLLGTSNPDHLLSTVRSRCSTIRLQSGSDVPDEADSEKADAVKAAAALLGGEGAFCEFRDAIEKCVKTRGDALMLIDYAEDGFRERMMSGDSTAAMADRIELCEKARADIERDMDRNKALKRLRLELTGH